MCCPKQLDTGGEWLSKVSLNSPSLNLLWPGWNECWFPYKGGDLIAGTAWKTSWTLSPDTQRGTSLTCWEPVENTQEQGMGTYWQGIPNPGRNTRSRPVLPSASPTSSCSQTVLLASCCCCVCCSVMSNSTGTVARQAPLSMELSRQESWSGFPFSSPFSPLQFSSVAQ